MEFAGVRQGQAEWAARRLPERLACLRRARLRLAERPAELAALVPRDDLAETLAAEILPLLDAMRYLELASRRVLRERPAGLRGRPQWLWGTAVRILHDPLGVVLIIGPANYPLMLPGIQMLQGLAAGNAVLIKPAPGCSAVLAHLRGVLIEAGVPESVLCILGESPADAEAAIAWGVDKVFLTGSAETGRRVQQRLAECGTPAVMELSGCDAVHVLEGASEQLVSSCVAFGLAFNGSRTCMAPRRLFVRNTAADGVIAGICRELAARGATEQLLTGPSAEHAASAVRAALAAGAVLRLGRLESTGGRELLYGPVILDGVLPQMEVARMDAFVPLLSVLRTADEAAAVRLSAECPYALSAAVFGRLSVCRRYARQLDVGCVVINDLIVPTADPRVAFGGRHRSGFGVTRGAAGLLEMTQLKTVIRARGFFRPHLDRPTPADAKVLEQLIGLEHARSPLAKLGAVWGMVRAAWEQRSFRVSLNRRVR
ncbi:MAG: NADP-dependent glyceraldehyde-3-phosphate dehydrogenase [Planctomycetota bacterium]|jgi:aldehyde dehydrogenase (NAD+)